MLSKVANLSRAFFISLFGPILGNPMVLVIMLELDMVLACTTFHHHITASQETSVPDDTVMGEQDLPVVLRLRCLSKSAGECREQRASG